MSPPSPENGSALPLRPALREEPLSPKSSPAKVVSIAEPESTTSLPPPNHPEEPSRLKKFKASMADKRMTGRLHNPMNSSSRHSVASQASTDDPAPKSDASTPQYTDGEGQSHHTHHGLHGLHLHRHRHQHQQQPEAHQNDKLLSQVAQWLQAEKAKRAAKRSQRHSNESESDREATTRRSRTSSQGSNSSAISLDQLQRILEENMSSFGHDQLPFSEPALRQRRPSYISTKRRSSKLGAASSDTEYTDGDLAVPSCDVVLDNSKTMSYSGGTADSSSTTVTLSTSKRAEKERKAWATFKCEILRLAHTLRLKGWRKVPLERGAEIEVKRLSGALTNAVYVVSPPKDLPLTETSNGSSKSHQHSPPPRLLLRVYGPQVEHLIDRENELSILRRLSRKKIGPRMLGTFTNGRFEEFFNAQTLTAGDLRVVGTSRQIAKRMRELHDGVDLLDREKEEGPFVFRNWDKWVDRCEEVITYLDKEVLSGKKISKSDSWRKRGLVCGVEWPVFRATIEKYRKWLDEYYGQKGGVNNHLVFAHNDTQYGNILRLVPEKPSDGSAPSPLLLPQNTHKQLIVIDFEYASANTPGLEFANHFTEWCYNYHDPKHAWACSTQNYPTPEEQRNFINSYVNHRPQYNPRASSTPKMGPMDGLAKGSISEFLLDSRTPGGSTTDVTMAGLNDYSREEAEREEVTARQVKFLMEETRVWRIANSAQWVAWGIVQAKIPELDALPIVEESEITHEPEALGREKVQDGSSHENHENKRPEGIKAEALLQGESVKEAEAEAGGEEDEFDYLAYAQDRAMFFWGDVLGLGLVEREELPEALLERIKVVEY